MKDYPEGEPCWAPGAADRLAELLQGDEVAWEWGGGASSVWLAPQVDELHVVEHDPDWADFILERTDESPVTVHQHPFSSPHYIDAVEIAGVTPTVWLIDGYRRIDCLELVRRKAHFGDLVVLDDALDYAEHLLVEPAAASLERFAMPHPYAGTPIDQARHKKQRNTVRTHHAETKETWIWRV